LLEHWREAPEGVQLAKLARSNYQAPEAEIETEFVDTLRRLEIQGREQRWAQLQDKLQREGLNPEEKVEWQRLLMQENERE
jgi:hypothetical protein